MRRLAADVEELCQGSEAMALASDFEIANPSRARRVLEAPVIRRIRHGQSGQLRLEVTAIKNARGFEVEFAEVDGWRSLGNLTNSRALPADGLVPGTRYQFRVRAVGGATGYSDWSEVAMQRCL